MPPAIRPAPGKRGSKNSHKKYILLDVGLTRAGPFSRELRFQSTAEHSMQNFSVLMHADSALALGDVLHLRNTLKMGNKPELADTFDAAEAALRRRGPNSSVLPQTCGSAHISNANGRHRPQVSARGNACCNFWTANRCSLQPSIGSFLPILACLRPRSSRRQKWHMLPAPWPVRRPALSSHSWPR